MPTTYYAPGVYIEEPDRGTKPIQGVSTSVTAFIGFTKRAEKLQDSSDYLTRSIVGEPTLITSWAQFERYFGGYEEQAYLPYAVRGFFDNGGTRCYVISVRTTEAHRAQAVINVLLKKDEQDPGKEIPGLVVLAKNGGTQGNQIQLQITPAPATNATNGSQQAKPLFRIFVRNGNQGELVSLTNGRRSRGTTGAPSLEELQSRIATLRQTQSAKQEERAALAQQWRAENVDLASHDAQWPKIKKDCLERPGNLVTDAQLETARQQYKALTADLDKVRVDLPAAEQALRSAEEASAIAQREGWDFALEDLPVWGERERSKEQNELADSQSDLVQVWRIHKRGKEAASLPVYNTTTAESAFYSLRDGALTIDQHMLTTTEAEHAAADKGAKLFTEKSTVLYQGSEAKRRGIDSFYAFDDINLVCAPDIMKAYELMDDRTEADNVVKAIQEAILTFCKRAHYPFAILDAPPIKDVQTMNEWRMGLAYGDTMYGALYYPWIKIADPFNAGRQIAIPPSGHLAGLYARSDSQRGVHKAPANEPISGALDLTINVTKAEQELLNPNGVNCIRQFPGRGIRVWGARTLALTDPSWRYINVRRLFSYVEASVERSTQWVVFEPNDYMLWSKVRRDVTAFLRTVWLSGALFGLTPEQSFYVKCDEETNLLELRDLGQMVCEIGMAPVKPAEFVIFRFSQWAGQEA